MKLVLPLITIAVCIGMYFIYINPTIAEVKALKVDEPKTDDRTSIIEQTENKLYKTTVITCRVIGQYGQFLKFLQDLESSLNLVDVTSLSMKTLGGQTTGNSSLEFLLEMKTYSLQ